MARIHQAIYLQEHQRPRRQEPEEGPENPINKGDQVYIGTFMDRWHEPRRTGPFEVTSTKYCYYWCLLYAGVENITDVISCKDEIIIPSTETNYSPLERELC